MMRTSHIVSTRCNRFGRKICSVALKMTNAATVGSKEDDVLFYNIINADGTPKEIIRFLIKQRENAAQAEREREREKLVLMMQAEKEKHGLVMKAEKEKLEAEKEKLGLVMKAEKEKLEAEKEKVVLVMQAEKEKLEAEKEKLVMQAEISRINAKFIEAQRKTNSDTPRDIIGNLSTFSFHNFIIA